MYIKNVVILPSKIAQVNSIGMFDDDNTLCILRRKDQGNKFFDTEDGSPVHGIIIPHLIYIISDDKIRSNDYVYNSEVVLNRTKGYSRHDNIDNIIEEELHLIHPADKKIVATNDPTMYVLGSGIKMLDNVFVEKYVATYNRIKKVKRILCA